MNSITKLTQGCLVSMTTFACYQYNINEKLKNDHKNSLEKIEMNHQKEIHVLGNKLFNAEKYWWTKKRS